VLDNASADGSAHAIKQVFGEQLYLIESTINQGFARGNNAAAQLAKGEYLLLLNPDTVVLDGAIDKLMDFAGTTPGAGIWGGRTLSGNRSLNPGSCWMKQTLWGLTSKMLGLSSLFRQSTLFNPEGIGGWNREGVKQVDIVSGCFFLIRHDLWKKLEGFHPDFFMYGEEADLCLRAKQLGAQPVVSSNATIVHYGGASEKIQAEKFIRLLKAKGLLIHRHFPAYQKTLALSLLAAWPLTRFLAHSVISFLQWKSSSDRQQMWKTVWLRRKEWLYFTCKPF
jgi:GT2 family glycosyltransferase